MIIFWYFASPSTGHSGQIPFLPCWERAQPRVVGAREAVASVLGRPGRTGQGALVLPALLEYARCSVQPPPAQRRLRAHVRVALPPGSQADLRGPTAV